MPALEATSLSKRFGGVVALSEVQFTAESGEVHALMGENGAGKSTFVKVITGLLRPDEGDVRVFGRPLHFGSPRQATRTGIAAVMQEVALVPDLTVSQGVWFRHEPRNRLGLISDRRLRRDTTDLFERLGLHHIDVDRKVADLSLAERQLVDIARAVARRPRILILDEATSALSAHDVEWTMSLARRLASEGSLVIFISHRLREVRAVSDSVTIFRNARTVGQSRMSEITDDELVSEMLGRSPQQLYPPRCHAVEHAPALEVLGLSIPHRLRDVSFVLHKGEILGLGGLEGQGQGALLGALSGIAPAIGEVSREGKRVSLSSPRSVLRAGIALVPEDRHRQGLLLSKTIRENASLPILGSLSHMGMISRHQESEAVATVARQLQVKAPSVDTLVSALSGGNQQKVLMSRILLTRARVLLLYDPLRGVDVGTKADIFELFRRLTAEGYSLLFHSTEFQELVNLCDRVLIMKDGELAATLQGEDLTESAALQASVGSSAA